MYTVHKFLLLGRKIKLIIIYFKRGFCFLNHSELQIVIYNTLLYFIYIIINKYHKNAFEYLKLVLNYGYQSYLILWFVEKLLINR